jgi:hypothetical protein
MKESLVKVNIHNEGSLSNSHGSHNKKIEALEKIFEIQKKYFTNFSKNQIREISYNYYISISNAYLMFDRKKTVLYFLKSIKFGIFKSRGIKLVIKFFFTNYKKELFKKVIMLYFLFIVLFLINLRLGLRKKHSNYVYYITFIFLWILIAGNTVNPDLISYNNIYYGDNLSIEYGFVLLTSIGRYFNLKYETFVFIISFLSLVLVFYSIKLYTKNINFVIAFYMIYPFVIETVQFRNLIASSVLIFSLKYLLRDGFKNKIKYLILILIAGSLHQLFYLYIIFLLIKLKNKKKVIISLIIVVIVISLIIFLNGNQVPFLNQLTIISEGKLERYFSIPLRYGFLVNWSINSIYVLLIYLSKLFMEKYNDSYNKNEINFYVLSIFWINVLTILFFPLYMLNVNFYRLYRNISLINYIVFAIVIDAIIKKKIYKLRLFKYFSLFSILIIIMFYYDVIPSFERVFRAIMENNVILYD